MKINSTGNIVQVVYFDELGMPLSNATVTLQANEEEYTTTTDDDGIGIFKLNLPGGKHTVSVINPITGKYENITLTIPSDYKKPYNTISNVKKVQNTNIPKTLHKTCKVSVNNKIIGEGRYVTLQTINNIFDQNFINGHLTVYIDGKIVFNATVTDDLSTIIFEIIDSLLGNHELKVEYTIGTDTQTYTENITIN